MHNFYVLKYIFQIYVDAVFVCFLFSCSLDFYFDDAVSKVLRISVITDTKINLKSSSLNNIQSIKSVLSV